MTRRGVTMIEILIATAILGAVMLAAYTWLEQDFRFARDLVGRETADTLVRNLLERYRHMPPEVMIRLVGEDGEVDPGELEDATLDRVDPRDAGELARRGHHRGVRVWRRPGPLGGVGLSGRATWRSVDGELDQFEFGVAQLRRGLPPTGGGGAGPGGGGGRGGGSAPKTLRPSGFRRLAEVPDWGTRRRWSVPRAAGAPAGRGGGGGPSGGRGAGDSRGGAGGSSGGGISGGGSGGSGGGGGGGGGRRGGGRTAEVWGGSGLEELIRKAAQQSTEAAGEAKSPAPTRVASVQDERGYLGRLTGEDGTLARSYREALERLRARPVEQREQEFLERSSAGGLAAMDRSRVPPGRYTYVVDVLDERRKDPATMVGSFRLTGDAGRFRLVLRELGAPPGRRTLEGDDVLDARDLRGARGRRWKFWRTQERLVLVEYPAGFFPATLVLADLPAPDPAPAGTTMTRRAVQELLTEEGLNPASEPHPRLLVTAAAEAGSF